MGNRHGSAHMANLPIVIDGVMGPRLMAESKWVKYLGL